MATEQIMYFALGFLIAFLLALIILPSVWKRAVRLTKKRIEATTPITMAEFRADKDQLRAGFALTSRRLERNIETLRTRLTEQLTDLNTSKSELAIIKAGRDEKMAAYEAAHKTTSARILQLEQEVASLTKRLNNQSSLDTFIEPPATEMAEKRAKSAIASIKQAFSFSDKETFDTLDGIDEAYSRISSAGSNLSALLEEEEPQTLTGSAKSLAEKFSQDDRLGDLRHKIIDVETSIQHDWINGKATKSTKADLRKRLSEIASSVSQLIYATDSDPAQDAEESLFDRIRKFAGDGLDVEEVAPQTTRQKTKTASQPASSATVSDRIAAFQDIHANN